MLHSKGSADGSKETHSPQLRWLLDGPGSNLWGYVCVQPWRTPWGWQLSRLWGVSWLSACYLRRGFGKAKATLTLPSNRFEPFCFNASGNRFATTCCYCHLLPCLIPVLPMFCQGRLPILTKSSFSKLDSCPFPTWHVLFFLQSRLQEWSMWWPKGHWLQVSCLNSKPESNFFCKSGKFRLFHLV